MMKIRVHPHDILELSSDTPGIKLVTEKSTIILSVDGTGRIILDGDTSNIHVVRCMEKREKIPA